MELGWIAPREYHEKTGRLVRKDKIFSDEEKKDIAMRNLRYVLADLVKGALGLRLECWRMSMLTQRHENSIEHYQAPPLGPAPSAR